MTSDEKELAKRFQELSRRAEERFLYIHTHFLTEGEQAVLRSLSLPLKPYLTGGFPEAERCVAVFGEERDLGYPWESCIRLLKIAPKDYKFADPFSHRDFLGAILNLGIKRELLGDILIWENNGYVFVMDSIATYLVENLERVRHTAVKVSFCDELPPEATVCLKDMEVIAASPRLDAIICAVWNLSRTQGQDLVKKEKVTVAGRLVTDPAKELSPGNRVSVRGYGRFYYDGEENKTRSGRLHVKIRLFV